MTPIARRLAPLLLSTIACGGPESHDGSGSGDGTSAPTSALAAPESIDDGIDNCTGAAAGPPAPCDDPCDDPCGCQFCVEDAIECNPDGPRDVMRQCTAAGCYDEIPCAEGSTCIAGQSGVGACSDSLDCAGIDAIYAELIAIDQCSADDQCRVLVGHCAVGLGGECFHGLNMATYNGELVVTQEILDELAAAWQAAACGGDACDPCPEPPVGATCASGCQPMG